MDFKESSYYKLNKTLLCLIGQWPYQKRKTYLTRRFVVILYCSVSTLMQLYVLIKKNFDWLLIFAIYPLFMIVLNCLTLAIIFYRSIDKLEELWLSIKEDWAQNRVEEENRIKVSYAESGEAVTRYMTVAITIIGMTFVILTFFISNILDIVMPTNETRKRVHPFSEEYFFIDEKYFNIILIHSYASVAIILTFVLANISLFYILMQHICGMFAVLGYRFQRMITRKISRQDCDLKSLEEMYSRSIVSSILYHQRVIKFAKLLEAYYSPASMMNTAVFLLTMSPLFVQLSNTENLRSKDALIAVTFTVIFFILNYMGQRLIDISSNLCEKVYSSDWYKLSPTSRRLLLLIIRRCNTPARISIFNIYSFSFQFFRRMIQAGFSYFMVLKQAK